MAAGRSQLPPGARLTSSVVGLVIAVVGLSRAPVSAQWPQWGGPNRNFTVETEGLADKWPDKGPKRLWRRMLGTGYSTIAVDDGRLYTMYRTKKNSKFEYTAALDAVTGKTIWKKRNAAPVPSSTADHGKEFSGPNATPLVVGDRLFTIGRNAMLHCYQKTDGTVLWKQDLQKDFGAQIQTCGFSSSPIAYGNTIIIPLGREENDTREGGSLVAFEQASGSVVWRSQTFGIGHSSPILINLGGEDQLVQCTTTALIGVNPVSGELLWEYAYPDPERFQGIFATPVWSGDDVIMFSSRQVGCAIRLTREEGRTSPELLWSNNKALWGMPTPVLFGDMLVGTKRQDTGLDSPTMAVDIHSGERLWIERGFLGAVVIGGGETLILLDYTGKLGIATVSRSGLTVHSVHQATEQYSFTAPTLVGTTLYVRDERKIMAFDLGKPAGVEGEQTQEGEG